MDLRDRNRRAFLALRVDDLQRQIAPLEELKLELAELQDELWELDERLGIERVTGEWG